MVGLVKICGLTCIEDVQVALDAGANAVGFVLEPTSPRHVLAGQLEKLVSRVPPNIVRVAVMGPFRPELIPLDALRGAIDVVQAINMPPGAYARMWQVVRPSDASDVLRLSPEGHSERGVIDAFSTESYGGSGHRVPTEWAREIVKKNPDYWILAGGLTPENVAEAIGMTGARGVDVSSGVEQSPGQKDHQKVMAFVKRARKGFEALPSSE